MAQELAGTAQEIQLSQHVPLHLVLQSCLSPASGSIRRNHGKHEERAIEELEGLYIGKGRTDIFMG